MHSMESSGLEQVGSDQQLNRLHFTLYEYFVYLFKGNIEAQTCCDNTEMEIV